MGGREGVIQPATSDDHVYEQVIRGQQRWRDQQGGPAVPSPDEH